MQTDACIEAGLEVPRFSAAAFEKLSRFVPSSGTIIGNPLDSWQLYYRYNGEGGTLADVLKIVSSEKQIHTIIIQFDVITHMYNTWGSKLGERLRPVRENLLEGCRYARDKTGKLVLISMLIEPYTTHDEAKIHYVEFKKRFESQGFIVYPTVHAAVKAAANAYKYTLFKRERANPQYK